MIHQSAKIQSSCITRAVFAAFITVASAQGCVRPTGEAELRRAIISGVHSPSKYRTWSVRNHDAWYDAFNVRPGDRMYLPPKERVRIW